MRSMSRRTLLRGAGVSIALPWLEAMAPRAEAAGARPPRRVAWIFVPNGMHMPHWTPTQTGRKFDLPPTLKPLASHREYLSVLSGLALNGGRDLGDGPGDHARSVASYLTGAHPRKTHGANIHNGVSVDQAAAAQIGGQTRFASLELGCEQSASSGNCDSGYSCAYSSNIAWRTPTTPVSKEVDPQAVFDRLFSGKPGNAADAKLLGGDRDQRRRSVLDFARDDAQSLRTQLGAADQRKLDEYLYAVRDVERRIAAADKLPAAETKAPNQPRPAGVPRDFTEHLRLMMDMLVLAFQTDSTRLITFMYTNDLSNRSYPQLNVRDGHHELSHHGGSREKQQQISRINVHHLEQFAYLVDKLHSVKEQGASLLDHSLIMYGSGIGDGDAHDHGDVPIILVGKFHGALRPGFHQRFPKETPLCNLYVWMLNRLGARTERFGDSNGKLDNLGA